MTAEVPTGFVVVHDMLTVQLPAPDAIVHEDDESVSVPVSDAVWPRHMLPVQLVPAVQLEVAV